MVLSYVTSLIEGDEIKAKCCGGWHNFALSICKLKKATEKGDGGVAFEAGFSDVVREV